MCPSGMPVEKDAHVPRPASGGCYFENSFALDVANTCGVNKQCDGCFESVISGLE
jgi:hypothetical protein